MVVIMVAATFILFIAISLVREHVAKKRAVALAAETTNLANPSELYFHPNHTHIKVGDGELVEVGMDNFARRAVGKIDELELPEVGQEMQKGDVAWKAKIGSRSFTQKMPIDGIVTEVFPEDGKNVGSILKVKATNLKENLKNLIHGSAAKEWFISEKAKFLVNFSSSLVPAMMQDGGELVNGFGRHLTDDQWKEFCKEFFLSKD